jgi:hypothetical protein
MDMRNFGMRIDGVFTFPYPIVYAQAGTILQSQKIYLDLLDPKMMKRNEIFIIARADGKTPTLSEIR